MRPNIRIEIQNNLADSMEVEDGEISADEEEENNPIIANPGPPKPSLSIFDKIDPEKLQERARRFQLEPEDIKTFTDAHLQQIQASLGINPSNESNIKFESLHVSGIDGLTGVDILEYFMEYAPVTLEWVTDNSCNVVWNDRIAPARALHFMSRPVNGMPARSDAPYIEPLEESEEDNQSILIRNVNREVVLQDPEVNNPKISMANGVDIMTIKGSVPPGYWRLGNKEVESRSILIRYALRTDMKPFKSEPFNKFFKLLNGPKKVGIFARNKELNPDHQQPQKGEKNPWSVLAETWDEDAAFREQIRHPVSEPIVVDKIVKNPSLRVRLGTKRPPEEDTPPSDEDMSPVVEVPKKKSKIRMRMYADEEEEKVKRKKILNKISQEIKKIDDSKPDLRRVLNMNSQTTHAVVTKKNESFDLGTTLKNRSNKLVFELRSEPEVRQSSKSRLGPPTQHHHRDRDRDHGSRSRASRRRHSSDYDSDRHRHDSNKPRSKVAVVIKTQKRPTVASAVASTAWSTGRRFGRVHTRQETDKSESDSDSSSSTSSSSSSTSEEEVVEEDEEEEEEEEVVQPLSQRPGFRAHVRDRLNVLLDHKSPLKIEISNEHCSRR